MVSEIMDAILSRVCGADSPALQIETQVGGTRWNLFCCMWNGLVNLNFLFFFQSGKKSPNAVAETREEEVENQDDVAPKAKKSRLVSYENHLSS